MLTKILLLSLILHQVIGDSWLNYTDTVEAIVKEALEDGLLTNTDCVEKLMLFVKNLVSPNEDNNWALKMIDASAKPTAGILEYNIVALGRFEECLNIESIYAGVKGKYCLARLAISSAADELEEKGVGDNNPGFFPSLAVCLPDKCDHNDVKNVISKLLPLPWRVICQTKEDLEEPFDVGALCTLAFFALVGFLMVVSSVYDYLMQVRDVKPSPLLASFSVYTNGPKLFRASKSKGEFSCVHGIRLLSMVWVIYGHTAFFTGEVAPSNNGIDFFTYLTKTTRSMILANAPYSVDTFFLLSGMLVVYSFMKATHEGKKFNIFKYYCHRYLRLTPPIVPVILFHVFLVKYAGTGPLYPNIKASLIQPCIDDWWKALLYVQNYGTEITSMCIAQSWYLDVDFQLYLISPLFLLFLPKYPKIALSLIMCGTTGTILAGYFITEHYQLPALMTNLLNVLEYTKKYYIQTYTRAPAWFVGALLGYVLSKINLEKNLMHLRLPKAVVLLIWAVILTAIPLCIFAGHDQLSEATYSRSFAIYNALARPAWAVCVSWVIFACVVGYGGIIDKILSWSVFQILGRFTYSMYLTHYSLLNVFAVSRKDPVTFSMYQVAYDFWGITAVTFAVSIFWVLAFESPFIILEKYLFGEARKVVEEKAEIPSERPAEIA